MGWTLPTEQEMEAIEASTPKIIPDLAEGHFSGTIIEVETMVNKGIESMDKIILAIKIEETDKEEHIGQILMHFVNVLTKRGRVNPASYRFLSALLPQIKTGGEWHPKDLTNITFTAEVKYNGNFWNFTDTQFVEKGEGLGL